MRDLRELSDPDRILLWDLDGTIVDTAQDIAAGVAGALLDLGLAPLSKDRVILNVGLGVRVLMERCLAAAGCPLPAIDFDSVGHERALSRAVDLFRRHYAQHLLETTRPFDPIDRVLRELSARGRRMAIVSNKPEAATRAILSGLDLLPCFVIVVGGDTLPSRKPSPEPLWHALKACALGDPATMGDKGGPKPVAMGDALTGLGAAVTGDSTVDVEAAVMADSSIGAKAAVIGDSAIDVEAARAAGLPVCGVAWGFDPEGRLQGLTLDWWMERPEDLGRALLGE